MTIKDRVGEQHVGQGSHGGKGRLRVYTFFEGQIDSAMHFADAVWEPGAYTGYHRHGQHETIVYVVSGKGEHFQEGDRCTMEPGDALLVKAGQAHAIKNISDEDLRVLEFVAPGGELDPRRSLTDLPLPEALSDWE